MHTDFYEAPSCHSSLADWAEANPDERNDEDMPPSVTVTGGATGLPEAQTALGSPPVQCTASILPVYGGFYCD